MQTSKVLTILVILTISSGCASVPTAPPLCYPDRPVLEAISVDEQREIPADTLLKIGTNDAKLKSHIRVIERLLDEHNKDLDPC